MGKKSTFDDSDGWGLGKHGKGDVIYNTPTPYLDYLNAVSSHSQLQASGENVGLPDGQMGNSEVGHLNIGAGRVVYQDLVKINKACENGDILKNKEIISAYSYAQKTGKKLHLMGLNFYGWRTFFAKPSAQINRNRQRIWLKRSLCTLLLWTVVIPILRVAQALLPIFRKLAMPMEHT